MSVGDALLQSYESDPQGQYLDKGTLPTREECVEVLRLCFELIYPGYSQRCKAAELEDHVHRTLAELRLCLSRQIASCLCYGGGCEEEALQRTELFLERLPEVRRRLLLDAQAALSGDPAATNLDEIILCYPGQLAIGVHRLAHELYRLQVPMLPRILSEWAHSQTGADIHPAAEIGESFFLDHATGAVIGATARIGNRCRFYQGVTLGALSLPRNRADLRGHRRHPTVEDDVTIYANAVVLGGDTTVGRGSVVGGSVFLTSSIPERHKVSLEPPRLRVIPPQPDSAVLDFEI